MEFDKEQVILLLQKYLRGELQPDEYTHLQEWANSHAAYRRVLNQISTQGRFTADLMEFYNLPVNEKRTVDYTIANQAIRETPTIKIRHTFWRRESRVAAILVVALLAFGSYWYLGREKHSPSTYTGAPDKSPGRSQAVLTLADGRAINLSEAQTGIVISDEVTYLDGSQVTEDDNSHVQSSKQHSIATPKGGMYQITLADGSKVWLNAASTLKYPSRFTSKERVVELLGEAYFIVANDKKRPFKVITNGQQIEVLGTEFNISAYDDEPEIKTTLVAGAVRIAVTADHHSPTVLRPGEQATLRDDAIMVQKVDVTPYTAWKNSVFHFKNTPFEEMMRQIARWYDVDVIYANKVPKETFTGEMSRNLSLITVLDLLNVSEVRIQFTGNQLIVE
ncbi:FecR family protein [Parapedobacter indicus]|uniref:FecR family protein n=1 Tax=Parapedobacter indicus TaxID=1477437 RepID=A0A1I3KCQ8_9SPHI|nr:FecR family protein [Parapedobacter indicus]PPL01779.1 FecR family protein [Parapedobacter indicus]SFI70164.1 FecR family protein [Parapedobacter indicus]